MELFFACFCAGYITFGVGTAVRAVFRLCEDDYYGLRSFKIFDVVVILLWTAGFIFLGTYLFGEVK